MSIAHCKGCPHLSFTTCASVGQPVQLLSECPEKRWPEQQPKRLKVLWLLGDFARGGQSRYTADLFLALRTLPIDFTIMYIVDTYLDETCARGYPLIRYSPEALAEEYAKCDLISCIGISKHFEESEAILPVVAPKMFGQLHGTCQYTKDLLASYSRYTNKIVAASPKVRTLIPPEFNVLCPPQPLDFNRIIRQRTKEEAKAVWGLAPADRLLVSASRMSHDKGLLELAPILKSLPEDVKFLLVGSGYAEGEIRLVLRCALGDRLIVSPWTEHITDYLDAADAFICNSPNEGGPLTVIEALAHGTPVVSTPVGVTGDYSYTPPGGCPVSPVFPTTQILSALTASIPREVQEGIFLKHSAHTIRELWWDWLNRINKLN